MNDNKKDNTPEKSPAAMSEQTSPAAETVTSAPVAAKAAKRGKRRRGNGLAAFAAVVTSLCAVIIVLYALFVYSNIPVFVHLRTVWIETAMTTMNHHWLAEAFIPQDIIDAVMSNQVINDGTVGGADHLSGFDETARPTDEADEPDDILSQLSLEVGDLDYAGYKVLINDIEQGLVISEIVGDGYKGLMMLVDDPSRVFLAATPHKGEVGMRILQYMEEYDAVAGINASGFNDPGGNGSGGIIDGLSCSGGEYWGTYISYYSSIVLTTDNKLVVGEIRDWENYNIRDGMQFGPVLIADGEVKIEGTGGYGIHPRTAIGQREDGVIAMLIIDGRDLTHSIGCTMGDLAEIMQKYEVINAACCDGGASSVLGYEGKVINKNCSLNPSYGRMMPNAFLVRKKAAEQQEIQ